MNEKTLCPNCQSENIELLDITDDDEFPSDVNYKCNICHYDWWETLVKEGE